MFNSKSVSRLAAAALLSAMAGPAFSAVINSNVPFVTTTGTTHTDVVAGATIAGFDAYDNSSITMTGGSISHANLINSATANISGGSLSFLNLNDSSNANVSGGTISFINLYDVSTVSVTGGDIAWLNVYENSYADVFAIANLSWLVVSPNARVTLHADNVSYNGGHLSGLWGNGSSFSFWAIGGTSSSSYIPPSLLSNITIVGTRAVPEPMSIALFGLGLAGLGAARRSSKRRTQI